MLIAIQFYKQSRNSYNFFTKEKKNIEDVREIHEERNSYLLVKKNSNLHLMKCEAKDSSSR